MRQKDSRVRFGRVIIEANRLIDERKRRTREPAQRRRSVSTASGMRVPGRVSR